MSTIKHNTRTSHSNSSKKSSNIKKADAPKSQNGAKETKQADKKDGFSASKELGESKKPKDSQKPGEEKDGKKPEEGKEKDKDSLLQKLSDLQSQLDEMKNKKEPEQPENLGGCCGKSHGSKKTEDPNQKEDPDSELTRLAVMVLQGPNAAQQQPQQGSKPGDKAGALKAVTSPAQAKAELSQKYQQYKTQGVQLRKETEQLVESALNSAGATTAGNPNQPKDAKNPTDDDKKKLSSNQNRPMAKAS